MRILLRNLEWKTVCAGVTMDIVGWKRVRTVTVEQWRRDLGRAGTSNRSWPLDGNSGAGRATQLLMEPARLLPREALDPTLLLLPPPPRVGLAETKVGWQS
ncbi:hypothetical protein OPV22_005467 [Ensete ventricosum]|uniref:Uncharacterized protein n=1 Tax=Ensete ventricosum TaxID=4639 RepID=A0AAV8Q2X0_ENSVE|nr:hypothetical protein OPV22_005467 [Ensete ventricosum]